MMSCRGICVRVLFVVSFLIVLGNGEAVYSGTEGKSKCIYVHGFGYFSNISDPFDFDNMEPKRFTEILKLSTGMLKQRLVLY